MRTSAVARLKEAPSERLFFEQNSTCEIYVGQNHKDKSLQDRRKRQQQKCRKRYQPGGKHKKNPQKEVVALDITEESERERDDTRNVGYYLDGKHQRSEPLDRTGEVGEVVDDTMFSDTFEVIVDEYDQCESQSHIDISGRRLETRNDTEYVSDKYENTYRRDEGEILFCKRLSDNVTPHSDHTQQKSLHDILCTCRDKSERFYGHLGQYERYYSGKKYVCDEEKPMRVGNETKIGEYTFHPASFNLNLCDFITRSINHSLRAPQKSPFKSRSCPILYSAKSYLTGSSGENIFNDSVSSTAAFQS